MIKVNFWLSGLLAFLVILSKNLQFPKVVDANFYKGGHLKVERVSACVMVQKVTVLIFISCIKTFSSFRIQTWMLMLNHHLGNKLLIKR